MSPLEKFVRDLKSHLDSTEEEEQKVADFLAQMVRHHLAIVVSSSEKTRTCGRCNGALPPRFTPLGRIHLKCERCEGKSLGGWRA